jgi:hypothetical protein
VKRTSDTFFTCKQAKEVWKALGIDIVISKFVSMDCSGSLILEEILGRSTNKITGDWSNWTNGDSCGSSLVYMVARHREVVRVNE